MIDTDRNGVRNAGIAAAFTAVVALALIGGCTTFTGPSKRSTATPTVTPTPQVVLYIYVCPQFVSEGCCNPMYWRINGTCLGPYSNPSGWINTGYVVQPSTFYSMPTFCSCANLCSGTGCSSTASFTTPSSFGSSHYCMPFTWQCSSSCSMPACP